MAQTIATSTRPAYHAYQLLYLGFIVAPLVAGLDKFTHFLTDWDMYLAPVVAGLLRVDYVLPLRASRHSMGTRDLTRCRRERQEANISFLLPWRLRVLACDPQRAAAANGPQPPIRMAGPHHRSVMLPHGQCDISRAGLEADPGHQCAHGNPRPAEE